VHLKKHDGSDEVEECKTAVQNAQLAIGLRGRPFKMFEDVQFQKLLEAYGKLQSQCDKRNLTCDPNSTLLSRRALSTRIRDEVTAKNSDMYQQLLNVTKERGAITFDFGINKYDYFVITGHVIDDAKLRAFILHFCEWQSGKKTKENVLTLLSDVLQQNGFNNQQIQQTARVTDEGSNVATVG
jgi:hypothetical protein